MTSKHTSERETRDGRYDHLMLGEVVDNADPLKIGRVRVQVPGLLDPESNWAFPGGLMLGVQNGLWAVPEVGSNVLVFLNQGDVDHPYYFPGPPGAPAGVSDAPEQNLSGDVNVVVFRWRDFHVTFDGRSSQEKLTVEDLGSGSKIELERATGDYLRDVEGSEVVNVKTDRDVTVEEGDETHVVTTGKRTTTIQGDDSKTIVTGDKLDTISVGSETKTLPLGGSTETMPLGIKTVNALTINLIATGNVSVTAGGTATVAATGLATLSGNGVSVTSSGGGATTNTNTGVTSTTSTGLVTETFLGAIASTITGAWTKTVSGIAAIIAATLNLGVGPTYVAALNMLMIAAFNAHTHGGVMAGGGVTGAPVVPITPGGAPPFDQTPMVATNVNVS